MRIFKFPLLIVLVICCFATTSFSQIYNYDYYLNEKTTSTQKSLVTCDNGDAASVHLVTEGNIISNQLARDILVNVVDLTGNIKFTKKYGNANRNDRGNSITKMADGGYIIVGTQNHPGLNSNGVLAYRINALGNIQWANWYGIPESRIGGEAFATFKIDEDQILVAGTSTSSRDLIALNIKTNGGLIWSKRYTNLSVISETRVSKVVTEIIEDQVLDGYIIAGTHYEGRISPNSKSHLFTFAVDANGNITRKYTTYMVDNYSSFNPAMAPAFAEGNFVLTCGARNGINDGLPNSYTVVMELDDNLKPLWTKFYFSPNTINQHGHSIYRADESDTYKVGCLYQGTSLTDFFVPSNTAFLSVLANGKPSYLIRYKQDHQQASTYMAHDVANGRYVIKSDNVFASNPSLGLIRTTLSGRARCARTEAVDAFEVKTEVKTVATSVVAYGGSYETRMATVNFPLRPDQCIFGTAEEGLDNSPELELTKSTVATATIKAYPTIVGFSNETINVAIQLDTDTEFTLRIYDGLGRLVKEVKEVGYQGNNQLMLDASDLPTGINVISLHAADQSLLGTTKIVKQ